MRQLIQRVETDWEGSTGSDHALIRVTLNKIIQGETSYTDYTPTGR